MPESLTTSVILECLKGLGLVIIHLRRDEHSSCWRIRTQGGPVVRIFDNGDIDFSGMKARVVRKALGLKGNYAVKIDEDVSLKTISL